MKHLARRCLRDHSAGVALMFALSAIPVIGVIGIAVDFGLATQAKAQLNLATDAAALAAAKGAADAFTTGNSVADAQAAGQAAGMEWFKSQAGTVLGTTLQPPVITWIQPSGPVFTAQVAYQGTVKPYFAPIFGVSTIALGGSSSATITTNAYVSVTFLLDDSSSMLIAANQDGIDTMNLNTPYSSQSERDRVPRGLGKGKCVFACHWDASNNDYYGIAKSKGVRIRFDVLQEATRSAIDQMISQRKIEKQFSVAIYTFDRKLNTVYPENTDLVSGRNATKGLVPPLDDEPDGTNFPLSMSQLATDDVSPKAGNGSSANKRKRALIIVTDGLADYGSRIIYSSRGPINPADCNAMKDRGYSIYVIYTTYVTEPVSVMLPFDNGPIADYVTGKKSPAMVASLQSCASAPTNYAEASDPDAINAAVTKMLKSALSNGGRYTQ